MPQTQQIDGLILGGAELPLILPGAENGNFLFLHTAKILVEAAVTRILG
jgi:aspartate/glutamate racemase